ncbi:MAG: PfkB family carbohydrate kinase [Qipengyuania citrea]|jgi:hypothetical protein|nr:PfkB family carbohydrate kinase [Erythrobacter sp. SAORIC-644]PNQ77545.1 nucleoside 2-deoxyribosyltransferase [Erythrobacter sp. SAORIC-644]
MTAVVGGVYAEECLEPFWNDVYGSGGRAAAALSGWCDDLKLVTYRSSALADGLENLSAIYGFPIEGPEVRDAVSFRYIHSLDEPRIAPRPDSISVHPPIEVSGDVVLRFGMLEGDARVTARRAVYDPQSAFDPRPFHENGSTADELALILNAFEARRLTNETEPERMVEALIEKQDASIVVLKLGGHGAIVATRTSRTRVPAYRSDTVWKLGAGDVFSAAFTKFWACDGLEPTEAADLASRSVSVYASTRSLPIPAKKELAALDLSPVTPSSGRVYIAAPFFTLADLWLVEEIRQRLLDMGVGVFSPLHDVGLGTAQEVALRDLEGLDQADVVLAVLSGSDPGTIFEVGYAVAKGKPVICLAQNMRDEDAKMPEGSGCLIVSDLVTAIYHSIWALA